MAEKDDALVLLAQITSPHGLRGLLKLRTYTEEPNTIFTYEPLVDETGKSYRLQMKGHTKGGVLVALDDVRDREAAERLRGLKLFAPRSALPAVPRDEYYQTDLIGLDVETENGAAVGKVRAIQNFGAGDLLEIQRVDGGADLLVPFTRDMVPEVDLAAGRLTVAAASDGDNDG